MGYAKRPGLTLAVLSLLVLSTVPPVVPEQLGVEPREVALPGGGANATMELLVKNDTYVLASHVSVEGRPSTTTALRRATPATTVAFSGGVDFLEPDPDMSWYYGDLVGETDLDRAAALDGQYLATSVAAFAYQLFLVDVDPAGLYSLAVGWRGHAGSSDGTTALFGASLYAYLNFSRGWSLLATYGSPTGEDRPMGASELLAPWRYVNRTLTGEWKVIVLAISHTGFNSTLSTDALNVTETHSSWPRPRLDVGADGSTEWGYGTLGGTGELGHAGAFDDGSTEVSFAFEPGGGHNASASLLVPRGSTVEHAFLDYRAFPTLGERGSTGSGAAVPEGGTGPPLQVTGVPPNAHHTNSSALLTDVVKHNITDQQQPLWRQNLRLGHDPLGDFSLAQVITAGRDGALRGVAFYVHDIIESPGNITVQVTDTSSTGPEPSPPYLGEAVLRMADVRTGEWNFVPLTGVQLTEGEQYSIVLMAMDSGSGSVYSTYEIGYNDTSPYAGGQAFVSGCLDGWSQPWSMRNLDLAFRTYVDTAIDPGDAQGLSVGGVAGRYAAGRVYVNLTGVAYVGGNWTFAVSNTNPFDVTFDWAAWTSFLLYADSPRLDVADDGTVDWSGELISTAAPIDIADALNQVLGYADWPDIHVDAWGNELLRVPLNLSVGSEGIVSLELPHLYYTAAMNTTDLSDAVNAAKALATVDVDGLAHVALNLTSASAGVVNVSATRVVYDYPPFALEIEEVLVLEDGPMVDGPLYLDTICFDDYDNNNLNYTVVRDGEEANITFELTAFNAVIFRALANWSGEGWYHVLMRDGRGLVNGTNVFVVRVQPVNDPPLIAGGLGDQTPSFERALGVPIDLVDIDSPPASLTVTTDSPRVTYDADNTTLVFLYPNGSAEEDVAVTVGDGVNSTLYAIHVRPIVSDTPPVVSLPPKLTISLDGQGIIDLAPYATDVESGSSALVWEVTGTSTGFVAVVDGGHVLRVIPVATAPGNYTLPLRVRDPDGNEVDAVAHIELSRALRHAPVILRGPDALPRLLKVERGTELVVPLALNRYWYDQEDYNKPQMVTWEAESLRPRLFSVQVDADRNLHIVASDTVGSGYLTLQLIDSDQLASSIESVQVQVVEPGRGGTSWLLWVLLVFGLVLIVGALLLVSDRRAKAREARGQARVTRTAQTAPAAKVARAVAAPEAASRAPAPEQPAGAGAPQEPVVARIQDVLVIHESTSLVAQMSRGGEPGMTTEKMDELIELSTMFAQERFEGAKVGTIKAFKFDGTEVLVGKGLNYYIVARCSGNVFEQVAGEMKRSIVNIDVQLSERLSKWYPGQRVPELEAELKDLLEGNNSG